jgi:hypothetical protein
MPTGIDNDLGWARRLATFAVVLSLAATAGCRVPVKSAEGLAAERAAAERAAAERSAAERAERERQGSPGKGVRPDVNIPATLVLQPNTVIRGRTYQATASLFWPGEGVTFSWNGPSSGMITTVSVAMDGQATTVVQENAAPGGYLITARGMLSGRTASAGLRVVTK